MKNIRRAIAIAVFGLLTINLQAQGFVNAGGQATDIAISPKDGSVYVVNASRNIKKYNKNTKKFHAYSAQSKNAKSVSVTKDGVVYMVSTSGEVHVDVKGKWIKVPGIKTNELIASKDGRIYAIDTNKKLRQLYNGRWNLLKGQNRIGSGLNQVLGIGPKELYARAGDNAFSRFSGGKWTTLAGRPNQIALDHKTGVMYAVGRNKGIYRWDVRSRKWVVLPGTRKDFTAVAVHHGKIWAVATNKAIYYYDADKDTTTPKTDYAGTYRVTFTNILRLENAFSLPKHDIYGTIGIRLKGKLNNRSIIIDAENGGPRVLDIPKNNPRKFRKANTLINPSTYIGENGDTWAVTIGSYPYNCTIDTMREFVLEGGTANDNAVFNFQFNLKGINELLQHEGKWQQLNLPIKDVLLGKEYYFSGGYDPDNPTYNGGICFKIEKIK
ncbi:tectonin domain-containing protein [Flagellimonas sp. DF-77]|uniref:tectonin domain-containing protein n=1 Tax=Flagellimonas algarum TaxID=3230298 RepID=UPI00339874C5